jgi:hypothetical protein
MRISRQRMYSCSRHRESEHQNKPRTTICGNVTRAHLQLVWAYNIRQSSSIESYFTTQVHMQRSIEVTDKKAFPSTVPILTFTWRYAPNTRAMDVPMRDLGPMMATRAPSLRVLLVLESSACLVLGHMMSLLPPSRNTDFLRPSFVQSVTNMRTYNLNNSRMFVYEPSASPQVLQM